MLLKLKSQKQTDDNERINLIKIITLSKFYALSWYTEYSTVSIQNVKSLSYKMFLYGFFDIHRNYTNKDSSDERMIDV